ncbi:MAG: hemolysin family protein [Waddliaceae bacterium]
MNWFHWLLFNGLAIAISAYYSMMEMSCVSFNKVRLHYYVSQHSKPAQWINYLLKHPFRLFGTTLIGVNVANITSSQCAREMFSALGLNPDLSPLMQVILVVIFGELAPMFAARHYAEHAALLGIPVLYGTAKLLTPLLWIVGLISKSINWVIGGKGIRSKLLITLDELQKIVEEHSDENITEGSNEQLNRITANIFNLRHLTAKNMMEPLHSFPKFPSFATVGQMREKMRHTMKDFILCYHKQHDLIVGIAFPRDLVRIPDNRRIREYAKSPWFVTANTPVANLLEQFKNNKQRVAIILNEKGVAIGVITLDNLINEIFGELPLIPSRERRYIILDRTFPGNMTVKEFNKKFDIILSEQEEYTLSSLMESHLGRPPEEGDTLLLEPFELKVLEASLLEAKVIEVKTKVG